MTAPHLKNAARALEGILAARHPGNTFIVEIGEPQRNDSHSRTPDTHGELIPRSVEQEAHTIAKGNLHTTGSSDDYTVKKAA